jgi:hypothetical protein
MKPSTWPSLRHTGISPPQPARLLCRTVSQPHRPDPLYAVLIPLLAEQLDVAPEALTAETRLYHDLDVQADDWEELLQLLGRTFDVDLTALNGEYHWPTKQNFWSHMANPAGSEYFPITVADVADWIKAGEFRYDYASRKPERQRKDKG